MRKQRAPVLSAPYYRQAKKDLAVAGWDVLQGDYVLASLIPTSQRRQFVEAIKGTFIKDAEIDMRADVLRRYDQKFLPQLVVDDPAYAALAHVECAVSGEGFRVPYESYQCKRGWLEEWLDDLGWEGIYGCDLPEPPLVTVLMEKRDRWAEVAEERTIYPHVEFVYGAMSRVDGLCCMVAPETRVTKGWLSALVRAWAATGRGCIVPASNALLGLTLQPQGGAQRLGGGKSYLDIAATFRTLKPRYPKIAKSLHPVMLHDLSTREDPTLVVADDTYVWRKGERATKTSSMWGQVTAQHRAAVQTGAPRRLPFCFYALNIGPWGGVAALIRVVEEMNETGTVCASIVYGSESDHQFDPPFSPLKMSVGEFQARFEEHVGWDDGVLCATHWWTPKFMLPLWERLPKLRRMAYWQDREDWFVDADGKSHIDREMALQYAAVPNRVVNAGWIADESEDLGLHRKDFTVVPVGFDDSVFKHKGGDGFPGDPIRILAMWRPMTPRRGAERLDALYATLKKRYGSKVSLEVFGEGAPRPVPKALDKHHGWVSHEKLAEILQGIDLAIEPSEFQGFGLFGVEALASGVPLVSTDNKGIWEYVEPECDFAVVGELEKEVPETLDLMLFGLSLCPGRISKSVAHLSWRKIGEQWAGAVHTAYGD